MDRFKFRIWDKRLKRYDDKGETAILQGGGLIGYIDWSGEGEIDNYCHQDDKVVEQCTGLRDKNGKLIYEGDIVRDNAGDEFIIIWLISDYSIHGGYTQSGFGFKRIKTSDNPRDYSGELEVIGNIHENENNETL